MKRLLLKCPALTGILFACVIQAQELKTGDALPDLVIPSVLNYKDSTLELADLRGKHVIFDFWTTGCLACIQSFPKLDSLQKKFKDRLQIILVTYQRKEVIEDFFIKKKRVLKPGVPMITGDEAIFNLFPRQHRPYMAMVDDAGRLRYVAGGNYLTVPVLDSFIRNLPVAISQLPSIQHFYNTAIREEVEPDVLLYSGISKYNVNKRIKIRNGDKHPSGLVLSRGNRSVAELFIDAYREGGPTSLINPSNFLVEMPAPEKYIRPKFDIHFNAWKEANSYSYELILPKAMRPKMYTIMQEDLKRYFGMEIIKVKRKVKCLVLQSTGDLSKLASKGGMPLNNLYDDNPLQPDTNTTRRLINKPFRELYRAVKYRVEYELAIPFLDETGYNGNIDINLQASSLQPFCFACIQQELSAYGLSIIAAEREVELYVLSEVKNN